MNFDAIWCSIYQKEKPCQKEKERINQLEETKARNLMEIEDRKIGSNASLKDEAALPTYNTESLKLLRRLQMVGDVELFNKGRNKVKTRLEWTLLISLTKK
ncbi:unnamed protein product [Coffea canephora]|uniref:Uncharacterized protein n=1 Tax=Coffea canephora TaxID=49390 RepID=A0A068UCR5_COFCA|nr:unnamed protein product [Coffea canephora]